ncbi:alpha/beta hydrolase family esterase [Neobacillus dielmonensis]|uniref:alpha/beta hydrolase family esterase n=1 Tax=Neobacillus dielmonensis TaxID=1347369 RepID=UPI00069417CB|nr:hypothetical protein [Neobacillus dielmonensis]
MIHLNNGINSATASEEPTYAMKIGKMTFDGIERTYKYYVPSSCTGKKTVPLLFSFHGSGSNSDGQITLTQFHKIAEKEGFIVVFPDSTVINETGEIIQPENNEFDPYSPLIRQWNVGTSPNSTLLGVDDVGFTSFLIDYFTKNYNIDERMVYATGMSNGSMFSNRLAVELSDRIAGIGAVTGQLATSLSLQAPKSPITTVFVMGDTDPVVPYQGRPGSLLSVSETINYWAEANGSVTEPRISYMAEEVDSDPTKICRKVYDGGKFGTKVVLYTVEGGGHTWPGGPQYLSPKLIGLTSQQMDASQVIWNELKTHKLPNVMYKK